EERDERGKRVHERRGGEQRVAVDTIEPSAERKGEHAAGAQAEQRDRDREKREVVVHDDREDACQRELGHEQRGGGEGDTGEMTLHVNHRVYSGILLISCWCAEHFSPCRRFGPRRFPLRRSSRAGRTARWSRTRSR